MGIGNNLHIEMDMGMTPIRIKNWETIRIYNNSQRLQYPINAP